MPSRKDHSEKTARALFLEHAAAYFDDLKASADNAPYGQVFDHVEAFAVKQGRELIRQSLETLLQEQIDDHQKKSETSLCKKCQTKKRHRGYRRKSRISSLGSITLERRYDECPPCNLPEHVADEPFGLEGRYSVGLRRLAVFSAADESFQKGSEALEEYLGLRLCHNTVRKLCNEEAPKMEAWQQTSTEVQKDFIEAPGVIEVTTDGTIVNTTEGPREVKLALIAKRALGVGVLPEQWAERPLPRHNACVAFAAVEEKEPFQKRFAFWRSHLRLGSTGDISALGDGAAWIWNITKEVFGNVRECLDIYHALEHLSATGKVLYGEKTVAYTKWYEEVTLELLSGGFELICAIRYSEQWKNYWKNAK